MDVLTAAWTAAGAPTSPSSIHGPCARCGRQASLTATRAVVSKVFTSFDIWVHPAGAGVCPSCAWGYRTPDLRSSAHLVTRSPKYALSNLTRPAVLEVLTSGRLNVDTALVVPLKPGRKHLIPDAVWGQITLDDVHLPWTTADTDRLQVVADLRSRGFGTRMLEEPAPPWPILRRQPHADWILVMAAWVQLDPWRTPASPWLALALHITVPFKEQI
jgi:hypothetical protein